MTPQKNTNDRQRYKLTEHINPHFHVGVYPGSSTDGWQYQCGQHMLEALGIFHSSISRRENVVTLADEINRHPQLYADPELSPF